MVTGEKSESTVQAELRIAGDIEVRGVYEKDITSVNEINEG